MEDFITFVDVFAPFLFFKLQWKPQDEGTMNMFNQQWSALRRAIMSCLRPDKSQSLMSQVKAYRSAIKTYSDAAGLV